MRALQRYYIEIIDASKHHSYPAMILISAVSATGQELICPEGTAPQMIMMNYDGFLLD